MECGKVHGTTPLLPNGRHRKVLINNDWREEEKTAVKEKAELLLHLYDKKISFPVNALINALKNNFPSYCKIESIIRGKTIEKLQILDVGSCYSVCLI